MSFFRDFLNLWHEWAAVDDMDDDDQTGGCNSTNDEDCFVTRDTDDDPALDEFFWASMEDKESTEINPATGLPMLSNACCFDVSGNPYGADLNEHQSWDDDQYQITGDSDSDPW